jgi:hypothetical protein
MLCHQPLKTYVNFLSQIVHNKILNFQKLKKKWESHIINRFENYKNNKLG